MSFYTLSIAKRRAWLVEQGFLTSKEHALLTEQDPSSIEAVLDACSENVIGKMSLPLSIVNDFPFEDTCGPLVLSSEETSVVAAINNMAKWMRQYGHISTIVPENATWGQVFLPNVSDVSHFSLWFEEHQSMLLSYINTRCAARMYARGGGCSEVRYRVLDASTIALDFLLDTVDAMGANAVNQVAAKLAEYLQEITPYTPCLAILSNHQPDGVVRCTCQIQNVPISLGRAIAFVSRLATLDTFRAVTHNKGIMNGVDALLLATGNDIRAAEASAHAYASHTGRYQPLSTWSFKRNTLTGSLVMPIPCGIVGGVTKVHPVANLALKIMKITTRSKLAGLAGAVGLLQNLAALRALATEGIVPGHMRLHIDNLLHAQSVDVNVKEALRGKCYQHLRTHGSIAMCDVAHYHAELQGTPS